MSLHPGLRATEEDCGNFKVIQTQNNIFSFARMMIGSARLSTAKSKTFTPAA